MVKYIKEFFISAEYFLRKIGRIQRQLKKAGKVKNDLIAQAAVAKKLDGYIAEFLDGKIEPYHVAVKKPELVGKKIIWQYWHQGLNENTPKLVRVCFDSVKKYHADYEIIILTEKTVNDYIELPDFVWEKFGKGGFVFPKLANLIRLCLLSAYGGVWLDATIFLTAPIDDHFLNKDFFALQRSDTPPRDLKTFTNFDPLGLSWSSESYVRMQNSYMIAKPNHKIINDLLTLQLEYWKREEEIGHYFFFQVCFYRMMQHDEWKNLNCEIVDYADFHRLLIAGFDRFDKKLYDEITARWNVHKLSLHWAKKYAQNKLPRGCFAEVILNKY